MDHCGTIRLETQRLVLRRFSPDDAAAMYKNWASDSEVTKYLSWPTHTGTGVTLKVLEEWAGSYSKNDYYHWAIVLKGTGDEPVGSIAGVRVDDSAEKVEIGYCLGQPWWRQGITSEALKTVMDFFFDRVCVNRVEAKHDPRNPHSGMVMKKCGMRYEGTLRSSCRNNQGISDMCYYAMLKSDRQTSSGQAAAQHVGGRQ